jgi:hypothetical protein
MKIINKEIIKALNPCKDRYDNYLVHYSKFIGTIEEFLFLPEISHKDKLWVGLRLLPRNLVEVFALDCAVSAQNYAAADAAYAAADAADAAESEDAFAAYAAAAYAADAADAADAAAEKNFQIEALIWLFNSRK